MLHESLHRGLHALKIWFYTQDGGYNAQATQVWPWRTNVLEACHQQTIKSIFFTIPHGSLRSDWLAPVYRYGGKHMFTTRLKQWKFAPSSPATCIFWAISSLFKTNSNTTAISTNNMEYGEQWIDYKIMSTIIEYYEHNICTPNRVYSSIKVVRLSPFPLLSSPHSISNPAHAPHLWLSPELNQLPPSHPVQSSSQPDPCP